MKGFSKFRSTTPDRSLYAKHGAKYEQCLFLYTVSAYIWAAQKHDEKARFSSSLHIAIVTQRLVISQALVHFVFNTKCTVSHTFERLSIQNKGRIVQNTIQNKVVIELRYNTLDSS